jgi:enterochelin esterase-like enzyme
MVQSRHVSHPAGISVLEPEGEIRRVVIALPGRGATAHNLANGLRPYLEALSSPTAVVTVDGGETYWHPRRSGEDRLTLLIDDVIPIMRNRYPHITGMGIIGWSMGGYGAINAAERAPHIFDRLCAISAAVWKSSLEQASAVRDAFDDAAQYARYDPFTHAAALAHTRVRLVCGTSDPFFPNVEALAHALRKHGGSPETVFPEGGCHNYATWERTMLADLRFVAGV